MTTRFDEAYQLALKRLVGLDRFEAEIVQHLLVKGYADEAPAVLERLRKQGVLNDRRVAEVIIRGRKALGNEILRQKLAEKGAPEELIDELLSGEDESEKAYQALVTKYRKDAPRAKAGRFLVGRGFDEDSVESALERFYQS